MKALKRPRQSLPRKLITKWYDYDANNAFAVWALGFYYTRIEVLQSFKELLTSRSYTVLPLPLPLRISQDFLGAYL